MSLILRDMSIPTDFNPYKTIVFWGDSIVNGTGAGSGFTTGRAYLSAMFSGGRRVVNNGIGGEPHGAVRDRFLSEANRYWPDAIHIVDFGRPSYGDGAAAYLASAQAVWDARPNDSLAFIVPSPGGNDNERTVDSSQIVEARDCRYEVMEAFPDNVIDTMLACWNGVTVSDSAEDQASVPTFDDTQGSVANSYIQAPVNGWCPSKYLNDDIHRNSAGQYITAEETYNFILANDW